MTKFVSIQYQHAMSDDLADLLLLEEHCFGKRRPYRRLLKRYFQSQVAHCIVAKQEENVVGYALIVFSPNMKTATVHALCVHPRMRGQGVGENLLNWTEVEALQSGASQITIEILYENDIMRHMLLENGYVECSDQPSTLPALVDGVKMRKRLFSDTDHSLPLSSAEIELSALNPDHLSHY